MCSYVRFTNCFRVTFSEAPRIAQCTFDLPLTLICRGCAPVKQAEYKVQS